MRQVPIDQDWRRICKICLPLPPPLALTLNSDATFAYPCYPQHSENTKPVNFEGSNGRGEYMNQIRQLDISDTVDWNGYAGVESFH